MNGKNFQELWKRGTDRLSDLIGSRRTSAPLTGPWQPEGEHGSLIAATSPREKPDDSIAGIVAKILEEDRSAILLRSVERGQSNPSSSSDVIDIERSGARAEAYLKIGRAVLERQISQILGIPRSAEDLLNVIAASDITGAPFAVWLTEVCDFHTVDSKSGLLDEALRKARLCFVASEPLRADIQKNYGSKVWVIPPWSGGEKESERLFEVPPSDFFKGLTEWIWKSLEAGAPIDDRFERLFARVRDRLTPYVDSPAPADLHWEMQPQYQALNRLRGSGYEPDFVVDVGASTGYWSHIATRIFPSCRYVLVEPLLEMYLEAEAAIYRLHPEFVQIKAAAGNFAGEHAMNVSPDLYGSSFFDSTGSSGRSVRVRVRTLDEIAVTESIQGRGLLKIDAQFSEHLVLDGGIDFLKQVDVIFIELSLRRFVPGSKTFGEIVNQLHQLGFEYRDYAGAWRHPETGELLQQDAIFTRPKI